MKNQFHPLLALIFLVPFQSSVYSVMKKTAGILLFILLAIAAIAQKKNNPIFNEPLKRGIYRSYEEFKNNDPSFTGSFYIDREPRKAKAWEGTHTITLKVKKGGKKIWTAWGFCEGSQVYISFQNDFFPIKRDLKGLNFLGYGDELDLPATMPFGPLLGFIFEASDPIPDYQKQKMEYSINPMNGEIKSFARLSKDESMANLVLYRNNKQELNVPFNFSVNGIKVDSFSPNSYLKLRYYVPVESIKICYGENFDKCFEVKCNANNTRFIECSLPSEGTIPSIAEANQIDGQYFAAEARYYQYKRKNKHLFDPMARLVFYRDGTNELDTLFQFKVNDVKVDSFWPGSYKKLRYNVSNKATAICYGKDYQKCIDIVLTSNETRFFEWSYSEGSQDFNLTEVSAKEGENLASVARYAQYKRAIWERDHPFSKLIVYRTKKKERDTPISFIVNNSIIIDSFLTNSCLELKLKVSEKPVDICYGENYSECINVLLSSADPHYVNCSYSKKDGLLKIKEVKPDEGKFYSKEAKYYQDKRLIN